MVIQGTLRWKEYPLNHPMVKKLYASVLTLVGGSIYVHGGFGMEYGFYRFSLVTRKWTKLQAFKCWYEISNVLVDDKIYVFGGSRDAKDILPIEAYDILTDTVEEFPRCEALLQVSTYVESRREIIIVGPVVVGQSAQVFGLNVDTKAITQYTTTAGKAPKCMFKGDLLVCGRRIFFFSRFLLYGGVFSMLSLGPGHNAAWSKLTLKGAAIPPTRSQVISETNGLLVVFGGRERTPQTPDSVVLIDTYTNEAVKVGPTFRHPNLQYEGNWPKPPVQAGTGSSNGRLWLFSGEMSSNIIELEIVRTQ